MGSKTKSKPKSRPWSDGSKMKGKSPSLIFWNPKYSNNVAKAIRSASCFGFEQVWFTGGRIERDLQGYKRLPREERMKGYRDVEFLHSDTPFDSFERGISVVALEVREQAESLVDFVHPENAVYVFGPEDGDLTSAVYRHCHRFVEIPAKHCLNLAVAASLVMFDRHSKRIRLGLEEPIKPGDYERRGPWGA